MIGNLFLCSPVPDAAHDAISAVSKTVVLPPDWRLVDPSEWHLTWVFLGPHDPEKFSTILDGVDPAAFTLNFTGWSFFPHPGRARVLALSGPTPPELSSLIDELTGRAEQTGWTPQHAKPFVLHLTVARGIVGPAFDVPPYEPIVVTPATVELWQTEGLNPARYNSLASRPCVSTSSASPSTP